MYSLYAPLYAWYSLVSISTYVNPDFMYIGHLRGREEEGLLLDKLFDGR
jgi:hypothetical protein